MTETAETNQDQNPLTKPKFIISTVVVAVLVAFGLIIALTPRGGGVAAETTSTTSPTAISSTNTSASSASTCGLPAGDQSKPVTTPTDTKWELVGKFATPTSPDKYGPGRTDANGLRTCFAHSPSGALYAGINIIVLGSSGRVDLLAQHLVVDGPDRDKMLKQHASDEPKSAPFQLTGFKVVDYSGDRAVIEYGVTSSNGSLGSFPIALQWQAGDWKWVPPSTGQPDSKQLSDLNGFIPWAGI